MCFRVQWQSHCVPPEATNLISRTTVGQQWNVCKFCMCYLMCVMFCICNMHVRFCMCYMCVSSACVTCVSKVLDVLHVCLRLAGLKPLPYYSLVLWSGNLLGCLGNSSSKRRACYFSIGKEYGNYLRARHSGENLAPSHTSKDLLYH